METLTYSDSIVEKGKVMVVDDDERIVRLLFRLLQREGYTQVDCLTQADQVLDRYREFAPDVVILDLVMPGVVGTELIQRLQMEDTRGYAPILILTGHHDPSDRVEALKAGARDYLVKPFLAYELLARVRNMMEIRRMYVLTDEKKNRLEEEVQQRAAEIVRAHQEILRRLGMACEFRDDETGYHTRRIGEYAGLLGEAMGLSAQQCRLLRLASPMHDIGKVGIPDAILLKPGRLTPAEFDVIKTHTTIGAKLLSGTDIPLVRAAEEIALSHHEKWDGSGYPRQLRGEDIPLMGRIVAVCDVFDALLSERPYKRAWTMEDTVKEIARCRGAHFDPQVVDAFLRVKEKLAEARETLVQRGENGP